MRRATLLALVACACACASREERKASRPAPAPTPVPSPVVEATPLPEASATPGRLTQMIGKADQKIREKTEELLQIEKKVRDSVDNISEQDERALGQATALHVIEEAGGLLLDDAALVRYVNRVANNVAQQGSRKALRRDGKPRPRSRHFVVGVLDDDDTLNAFSTPGGYVFVTSGLLRDLGSESELAWVLGHEIAHVDLEHGLKALELYVGQQAFAASLMGRDHAVNWDDPGFFGKMAGTMASISDRVYGKKEEREADALGLEYAVAAGYDADGAARVLDMLAERTQTRASPLATHDVPYARRVALEDAMTAAKAKRGYAGRVGASRFSRECIARLDGVRAATR